MTITTNIDLATARAFIAKVDTRYDFAGAILFGPIQNNLPGSDADITVILHGHPGQFVSTKNSRIGRELRNV